MPFGLSLSKPCAQYNQPFDSFRAKKYHLKIQPQWCPHKMAKPLNFAEQLVRTAQQELTAASARNNPSTGAEKPRDVILAACTAIGDQLAGDGFAFLKSGPSFKRRLGNFTHEIQIQSDRNNIAGQRAAIWIHASISSGQMATWRRNNPMPWHGTDKAGLSWVIGGQIGNLLPRPDWMEWDLADDRQRQAVIDHALSTIRKIALPFFALFDQSEIAVSELLHRPALWQPFMIEYALATLGPDAAAQAMTDYLRANPIIRSRYQTALAQIKLSGPSSYRGDMADELAAITHIYQLDPTD